MRVNGVRTTHCRINGKRLLRTIRERKEDDEHGE
jgi:hypothetical protein